MRTIVIGCNHRTAPISVRERLAFDDQSCVAALQRFREQHAEAEALILSTCNRTELYLARPVYAQPRLQEAVKFLADVRDIPPHEFTECVYHYEDLEAVRHLFRVVSSLDSMVVGESGILAQAKHALEVAREAMGNSAVRRLDSLFQRAFNAAKEVHSRTQIAEGHVSVGSIAVDFARQIFSHFNDKTALMIGAGEMGELTLKHLIEFNPRRVLVTNRTFSRAQELAERIGAEAQPFDDLIGLIASADIVLSCTGSPDPIITKATAADVPARRQYRPLLLIDFAVPRDIDPAVGDLQGLFVYDIDDLQRVTDQHAAERQSKIAESEQIIDAAVLEFVQWQGKRDVGPVISAFNAYLAEIGQGELEWLIPKLTDCTDHERELIEQMLHRVIKKVMHAPTKTLHTKGKDGKAHIYAATLRTLFDLVSDD
ncbi:MAG TPA: glutamyl-tRNA reductase [Phycisphaerae bacterium]|nr:glutamyl-tRNA reductase [Phycisphaerae bacterium]